MSEDLKENSHNIYIGNLNREMKTIKKTNRHFWKKKYNIWNENFPEKEFEKIMIKVPQIW